MYCKYSCNTSVKKNSLANPSNEIFLLKYSTNWSLVSVFVYVQNREVGSTPGMAHWDRDGMWKTGNPSTGPGNPVLRGKYSDTIKLYRGKGVLHWLFCRNSNRNVCIMFNGPSIITLITGNSLFSILTCSNNAMGDEGLIVEPLNKCDQNRFSNSPIKEINKKGSRIRRQP